MLNYFRTRWDYFVKCWKHAKSHKPVSVVVGISFVYGLLSEWGPVIDLGRWADTSKWPKLPLHWAVIILLVGLLFTAIEGGYRLRLIETEGVASRKQSEPNLIFQTPMMGGLTLKAGVWLKGVSYDGFAFIGINIPIKNEALEARPVGNAERTKAQVIFSAGGTLLRESSPASWLGESSKTIAIPVTETKELLVAFRGADALGYWQVDGGGIQFSYDRGELEVRILVEKNAGTSIAVRKLYRWSRTSGFPGLLIELAD